MADPDASGLHAIERGDTRIERTLGRHLARGIHMFLVVLAIVILAAAVVATYETIVRDFAHFFTRPDEYDVLQQIISNVLLIAIAAELGLLLLFHRTTAAMEVIILVIARKIIAPEITALELFLSVLALAAMVIVRHYYLPAHRRQAAE